jgi:hypothetical protein
VSDVRREPGVDGGEREFDWRINGPRHQKILEEKPNQDEKTK